MKKALSYVVVACLLLMSLSGMSFAATTYQPTISAEGGNVGDTITVTVSLPANSGAAGGSFNLIYDNTKLELVDAVAGEIIAANNPTVNKTLAANKIRVNFAGLNPISANGGVALTATFKAIADGAVEFSTEKLKLADANTNYLTCTDASKSITIAGADETVFKPTITVEGESDITVKVSLPADTNAAGGSFNLIYDNTKLELVDAKAGAAVPAATTTVNKTYAANKVRVSFAGTTPISANGGVALEVTFRAIADGTAAFEVEKFKLSNADGQYLICADAQTTANVKVDTTPVPVESVTLDKTSLTLTEGDSATLTATVTPTTAANKSVTWKTSDAKVATVANGVVTAKAAGKATITVTTTDGNKTATCDVTVEALKDGTLKISVESVYAKADEEVDVTISLSGNNGANGVGGITLYVDIPEGVSLVSATKGSALGSLTFTPNGDLTSDPFKLLWDGEKGDTTNGDIAVLKFKVPSSLDDGDMLPISISYNSGDIYDGNMDDIMDICLVNGSITIKNYILGDVNEDGTVNGEDITYLRKSIAGGYGINADSKPADVNKDGTVNGKDITYLRKAIAGGYGITLE